MIKPFDLAVQKCCLAAALMLLQQPQRDQWKNYFGLGKFQHAVNLRLAPVFVTHAIVSIHSSAFALSI